MDLFSFQDYQPSDKIEVVTLGGGQLGGGGQHCVATGKQRSASAPLKGMFDGSERLGEQPVVVTHVSAVPGSLIKQITKFFEGSRFASSELSQQQYGFLGLGKAKPDGAIVMNVDQKVRR